MTRYGALFGAVLASALVLAGCYGATRGPVIVIERHNRPAMVLPCHKSWR